MPLASPTNYQLFTTITCLLFHSFIAYYLVCVCFQPSPTMLVDPAMNWLEGRLATFKEWPIENDPDCICTARKVGSLVGTMVKMLVMALVKDVVGPL